MNDETSPPGYHELLEEVRRVGRAAVAARAAAEACEETVERLARDRDEPLVRDTDGPSIEARRLLEAILPVCDALGRIADDARRIEPPRSWLSRMRHAASRADAMRALREAVVLLDAQLAGALESCGVTIDRSVGEDVDPDRHRVVETRASATGERPGAIVRVVRPGYRLGAVRVREADVVATRP